MPDVKTLSVVIPAKNEERCLPILLDGLKAQTIVPNEIVVADAGSTDKTREEALAHNCVVVAGGLPGAGRNAGALLATGEWLLFLDADVQLCDPKFIEHALIEIENRQLDLASPDVHLLGGNLVDKVGHYLYNRYVRMWGAKLPHAPGFCIFIRRSLFEKVGGFDTSITLAEDHELAQRAGRLGRFGILNSPGICVTDRRFRRDGSWRVAIKYIFGELHMIFLGPIRHERFNYEFGYDEDNRRDVH